MSRFLKIILIAIGIFLLINFCINFLKLIPIFRRNREARRVRNDKNVLSVEAEVVEINTQKLNDFDTQFNVKLRYIVDSKTFYKEIVLLNRHSLRVGRKLTVLCDYDDPYIATLQDGSEKESTGNLIVNLFLDTVLLIIDLVINFLIAY